MATLTQKGYFLHWKGFSVQSKEVYYLNKWHIIVKDGAGSSLCYVETSS